jgi:hypothetical protein
MVRAGGIGWDEPWGKQREPGRAAMGHPAVPEAATYGRGNAAHQLD